MNSNNTVISFDLMRILTDDTITDGNITSTTVHLFPATVKQE